MSNVKNGNFLKELGTITSVAFRNLSRHKKATFLIGGVIAFGVLIVCMLQGWTGALMTNLSANLANLSAGHIYVQGVEKLGSGKEFEIIRDDSKLIEAMEATGLKPLYVNRRAEFVATLSFAGNSTQQSVSGIDYAKETYLAERLAVVEGSFKAAEADPKGIIISERVAKALKAKAGYKILAQLSTFSGQQNMGEFTISAIVKDSGQLSQGSMSTYANIDYVDKLLNMPPGSYQQLSFYMRDMKSLDQDAAKYYEALKERVPVFERKKAGTQQEQIMERLRGNKAETWDGAKYRMTTLNEKLEGVQTAVNWINFASLIALAVLFVIIMVGITNTFRMIMLDRIKEIGTMRALGMQSPQVLWLFLFEALFLSLGGALAGLILGFLAMLALSAPDMGQASMLALVLDNGHISFQLNPWLVLANIAIIGGLTLVAALIPALAASRLQPAQALRTEK